MLANFFIGLREGLEAALIVGILVAYVIKTNRQNALPKIFVGVALAIAISIGLGLVLNATVADVEAGTNQIIGASTSVLAVGFVTWMIFWMKSQSQAMGDSLRSKVDAAETSTIALIAIAFIAVIREGIETSIFLWSSSQATSSGDNPIFGAILGLLGAAVLGWLMFRGAVRINLAKFFAVTGAFLVLVSAGILAYAVMELEEIISLPMQNLAYDLTSVFPEESPAEAVLHGLIGFNAAPTMLQAVVWFAYLIPVGFLFLKKSKTLVK
ncbi:MAG: hypothetical protein RL149_632 [Actinomycetota bacterium]|jgi:high-affinity iron transporter